MYQCAVCKDKGCYTREEDKMPGVCPSRNEHMVQESLGYYEDETLHIAQSSAKTEKEGYKKDTRVEETIRFATTAGYKKLGVAFCVGLKHEAEILNKILKHHGFEVTSVICKNGALLKSNIGLTIEDTIRDNEFEVMCNPVGQALFLNEENVDLVILFGLCVGHDALVSKYANAPVTTLVAKDRVLGHNPIAAIYQADAYYKDKLFS